MFCNAKGLCMCVANGVKGNLERVAKGNPNHRVPLATSPGEGG